MKACIQRVTCAKVTISGETVGEIGPGMLVLLGVAAGDTEADAKYLAGKKQFDEAGTILRDIDLERLSPEMLLRWIETAECVGDVDRGMEVARTMVDRVFDHDRYVCFNCGESFPVLDWRCQKCKSWGSIKSRTAYKLSSNAGVCD